MNDAVAFASYLVRASRDAAGAVLGTIVRIRSGERFRFRDIEGAAHALARLLAADMARPGGHDGPPQDLSSATKNPIDVRPHEGDESHERD